MALAAACKFNSTERRVCGEMKHLDRVDDCRTHRKNCHKLDHRDNIGTNLVGLICNEIKFHTCVHPLKIPNTEFMG